MNKTKKEYLELIGYEDMLVNYMRDNDLEDDELEATQQEQEQILKRINVLEDMIDEQV